MGSQVGRKQFQEKNVYDAAIERLHDIFDRADNISIGFSGGKDSTAVLQMALKVAEERGKLPLRVCFFDEEAIFPTTVEYVERMRKDPRIELEWYCLPILHQNSCSQGEPFWFCWDRRCPEKWVRPLPEGAITHLDGFVTSYDFLTHTNLPKINHLIAHPKDGLNIHLMGLRADESLRRFQASARTTKDNYYSKYYMPVLDENGVPQVKGGDGKAKDWKSKPCEWVMLASPIYDWTTKDIWKLVVELGCDYNYGYDLMRMANISPAKQRICPPFGTQPLQSLHLYKCLFPEIWDKMVDRVNGASTAAIYARTELYGFKGYPKRNTVKYPTPMDYLTYLLNKFPVAERKKLAKYLKWLINYHRKESKNTPIHETEKHSRSGISWEFLYMIVARSDLKERKFNENLQQVRIKNNDIKRAPRARSTRLKK